MSWIDAFILGLIQGFTEFLPVSSSGHLEIGKVLLKADFHEDILFTVIVHCATVLSTLSVFYKDVVKLLKEGITFQFNESSSYLLKICISMLPVIFVGLFFRDIVFNMFEGNLLIVGCGLVITSFLLAITRFTKTRNHLSVEYSHAFIIGIAQALAVVPGISRSGSTIATGLLLGIKREKITKFSFLMVLVPIIGIAFFDLLKVFGSNNPEPDITVLIIGFISAFLSGFFACKWMINLVNKGNLIYFSVYCFILGLTAIIFA